MSYRWLPLLVALLAALILPALSGAALAPPMPRGAERAVKDKIAAHEERERKRLARRDDQAERQLRKKSRTAYGKLTGAEARRLAVEAFGEALTSPIWEPLRLGKNEKVADYLNTFNATVDTPEGRQVAVSTTPMRARDENDKLAAVDLTLEQKASAFVAANSSVDLSIGRSAGSAVRLARAGVSVTPVVDSDVAYEQGYGRLWGENVAEDTDQIVQPTTLGAELFWQTAFGRIA